MATMVFTTGAPPSTLGAAYRPSTIDVPLPVSATGAVTLAQNFSTEADVDAAYAAALAAGATGLKAPEKVFWGGYSGYFADPDGHLWEVAFNPFFPLSPEGRIRLP